ncbi:MAG: elongation factor Ts [Anaerolineaceae bacterium]|nr:elongation factor Ts [Anaerolineaceae bacterium]
MTTTIELIKRLREETGAGVLDCRQALLACNSNYAEALSALQEKAAEAARKRANHQSSQGIIELYAHAAGRMGVMVEVNCETDFTARSAAFCTFAHEIALQIAGTAPRWVRDEDIPQDVLDTETGKAAEKARTEGKPEALIPRITSGHLKKFMDHSVLLRQASVRDDKITIAQMLAQVAASVGENIVIRRFVRWELAEE